MKRVTKEPGPLSCIVRHAPQRAASINQQTFPRCFPVEARRAVLEHLFPKSERLNHASAIEDEVFNLCLVSRDCADSVREHFALPENRLSGYKLARRLAYSLNLNSRVPLEHVVPFVFKQFSHLELTTEILPRLEGDEDAPLTIHCQDIPVQGLLDAGIPAGWTGELRGELGISDMAEFFSLLQWLKDRPCKPSLRVEVAETIVPGDLDVTPDDEPLLDALASGKAPWKGWLNFQGDGATFLASIVLPRLPAQAWSAAADGNSIRVAYSATPSPVPAIDMSWTRGWKKGDELLPHLRGRFKPDERCQQMLFSDVDLDQLAQVSLLRVLDLNLYSDAGKFPVAWLDRQKRLERVELIMTDLEGNQRNEREAERAERRAPGDLDYLDSLANPGDLRHLLLGYKGVEGGWRALCRLLASNRLIETLTVDGTACEIELNQFWQSLEALRRLQQFNLTNLSVFPPARVIAGFLETHPGLRELRLHAGEQKPTSEWLQQVASAIARHPGLQIVELHDLDLDELARLCATQGRGTIELYDGRVSRVVNRQAQ